MSENWHVEDEFEEQSVEDLGEAFGKEVLADFSHKVEEHRRKSYDKESEASEDRNPDERWKDWSIEMWRQKYIIGKIDIGTLEKGLEYAIENHTPDESSEELDEDGQDFGELFNEGA